MSNKKYTYEIRLSNNKLTKDELGQLANILKGKLDKDYERIFISYYLPDMNVGSGAWAISHFNPDLNVVILGVTEKSTRELKKVNNQDEDIIGKWIHSGNILIVIFERKNKLYIALRDEDENSEKEAYTKKANGVLRYFEKGDTNGDFYIINTKGELEAHDELGFIEKYSRLK